MMNLNEFEQSLKGNAPPQQASVYLQALWYDADGDWKKRIVWLMVWKVARLLLFMRICTAWKAIMVMRIIGTKERINRCRILA